MSDNLPKLSLAIADQHQPTKLHRFRYLKEISDGRMGSILRCRGSGGKSPVTVTVTAGSVGSGCKLKLVGCTVFEDLMPHPFYLAGDDCANGVFEKELGDVAPGAVVEVKLEKVGIVCTPKKPNKSKKAKATAENGRAAQNGHDPEDNFYKERIQKFNFFNKPPRPYPHQGKDINKLRLAFQVLCQLPGSSGWTEADCDPVCTEVIGDAKIYSEMTVEYVIPNSVSLPDQDIWLYMKDPLPVQNVTELKVLVESDEPPLKFELQPKELKKHLVVFNFEKQEMSNVSGQFSVTLVEKKTGESSEPVKLELIDMSSRDRSGPSSKKVRLGDRPIDEPDEEDMLGQLLNSFIDETGGLENEIQVLYNGETGSSMRHPRVRGTVSS